VSAVTHWSYFGGFYQNAHNSLPVFAVDAANSVRGVSENQIPKEQVEAMIHTRTGAVISKQLAAQYGWKIGDRIPLQSSIWTRKDGSDRYPVEVVGIMDISAYNAGSFPAFLRQLRILERRARVRQGLCSLLRRKDRRSAPRHGESQAPSMRNSPTRATRPRHKPSRCLRNRIKLELANCASMALAISVPWSGSPIFAT